MPGIEGQQAVLQPELADKRLRGGDLIGFLRQSDMGQDQLWLLSQRP